MANVVRNTIKVTQGKMFKVAGAFIKDNAFDFNALIPMPSGINHDDHDPNNPKPNNWYDWVRENWGTTANGNPQGADKDNSSFTFETLWTTPAPVLRKLFEMFPDYEFEFVWEEEQGFGEKATIANGQMTVQPFDNNGAGTTYTCAVSDWRQPQKGEDFKHMSHTEGVMRALGGVVCNKTRPCKEQPLEFIKP